MIKLKFTTHARIKIKQRNILKRDIENVVTNPDIIEKDKFDNTLPFHRFSKRQIFENNWKKRDKRRIIGHKLFL
jgi:hypothetical protein